VKKYNTQHFLKGFSDKNVEKQCERRQRFCVHLDLNHHCGHKKHNQICFCLFTRTNEQKDWTQCLLDLTLEPVKPIAFRLYLFDEVAGRHVALRPLDDLFRQLANHNPPAHSLK
jgi:hypothetical protein